jgi:hypothetical protein
MYGFCVIEPIAVTDDVLTATNLTEETTAWSMTASFDLGEEVAHAGFLWRSLDDDNAGNEPGADGWEDHWQKLVADNVHAMFDTSIQSQSVGDGPIEAELSLLASQRAEALFVQNVLALEVTVASQTAEGDPLEEQTQSLVDNTGITNIWRYLFRPLRWKDSALFVLPNNGGAKHTVTIDNGDGDARCGDCVIGRVHQLGTTQWGGEVGMIDFSSKARDARGNFDWVEGAWADTGSFQVWVLKVDFDFVRRILREGRAKRRVYVAFDGHAGTVINGVWQDWRIVLSTPTHYLLSIPLESLA